MNLLIYTDVGHVSGYVLQVFWVVFLWKCRKRNSVFRCTCKTTL